jgi:ketosteroid isomerase-like protein
MAPELNNGLSASETLRIRLALEDLNTDFVHYLDHDEVDALIDLFCEDATYTHGERRSEGRAQIAELFRRRAASGTRTARHIHSGLRLNIESASRAYGTSVCLTFAGDGAPPLPARPLLVADFIDVYDLCDDGRWRFQRRDIKRIFVDPAHPDPVGVQR